MNKWDEIIKFNNKYFPGWRENKEPIFFSNALAGEVGEVCGIIKRFYGGGTQNKPMPTPTEIIEEAVDVYIYLVLFSECMTCDEENFDMIFLKKMMELKKRMENPKLSEFKENSEQAEKNNNVS